MYGAWFLIPIFYVGLRLIDRKNKNNFNRTK
jgi:hypothetical protein